MNSQASKTSIAHRVLYTALVMIIQTTTQASVFLPDPFASYLAALRKMMMMVIDRPRNFTVGIQGKSTRQLAHFVRS